MLIISHWFIHNLVHFRYNVRHFSHISMWFGLRVGVGLYKIRNKIWSSTLIHLFVYFRFELQMRKIYIILSTRPQTHFDWIPQMWPLIRLLFPKIILKNNLRLCSILVNVFRRSVVNVDVIKKAQNDSINATFQDIGFFNHAEISIFG